MVDRELFRSHAGGYLLESVAWHALASCLCYVAFLRTTGQRVFAFAVALFFAVHPANVENVAWLSERKSILNAVFWFCAIIAYLDFIETRSFRAYGIAVIALLLSLMSKPTSVTLPCTLVLIQILYLVYHPDRLDFLLEWRPCLRRLLLPVLPMLAISAYFSMVTLSAQSIAMADDYALSDRIVNMLVSYNRYLVMFFHPTQLAPFYPLFQSKLTIRAAVSALVVLAVVSACVVALVRRRPQLLIGWCWFLGTMVPAVGLVQVGSQSHADRYLYIPMLGLAFVFPVLFEELCSIRDRVKAVIVGVSLAVLGLSMILATQIQVSYWRDGVTLFRHALAVTGDCVTSVFNLTVAYHRAGRYDDLYALCDSKTKVAQNPLNKGRLAAMKASALFNSGKYAAAIDNGLQALKWGNTEGATYWILAVSYSQLSEWDKASEYLKKAKAAQSTVSATDYVGVIRRIQLREIEALVNSKTAPTGKRDSDAPVVPSSSGGQK